MDSINQLLKEGFYSFYDGQWVVWFTDIYSWFLPSLRSDWVCILPKWMLDGKALLASPVKVWQLWAVSINSAVTRGECWSECCILVREKKMVALPPGTDIKLLRGSLFIQAFLLARNTIHRNSLYFFFLQTLKCMKDTDFVSFWKFKELKL